MEKMGDKVNLNSNTEVSELCDNTLKHDISSSPDDTQPVKKGRGMPRREHAAWRYRDDGSYDNRPIDREYFKKYMNVRVPCPNCGVQVPRGHVSRHKKAKPCQLRTLQILLSKMNIP
jgi:hypothetical protein